MSCKRWSLGYPVTPGEDYTRVGFSPVKTEAFTLRVQGSSPCSGVPFLEQQPGQQTQKHQASFWTPSSPTHRPVFPEEAEFGFPEGGKIGNGTCTGMAQIIYRAAFPPLQNTGNSGAPRGHTVSSRNTMTHRTHTFHTPETHVC